MGIQELQAEKQTLLDLLERAIMADDLDETERIAGRVTTIDRRISRALSGYVPKVYFAGSIRGGRVDATLYQRMIAHIKESGEVLTEHVGDLSLSLLEQGPDGDAAIYRQDTAWLLACDVVIAECSCPSLGVGYELAYAEAHRKPVHVFYDRTKTELSAMIGGNAYFQVHPYHSEAELFSMLDQVLEEL